MSLNKRTGNMYEWVTHTHTHLAGKCLHGCAYCSVQQMRRPAVKAKYSGPIRLVEKDLLVNYPAGATVFIEHMNDLFADEVPTGMVVQVLRHCARFPQTRFVFQTKNPARLVHVFLDRIPQGSYVGITLESNRHHPAIMQQAPPPTARHFAFLNLKAKRPDLQTFVTVEPVLAFDPEEFAAALAELRPDFLNIGADSKGTGLPEPTRDDLLELFSQLQSVGIEVRQKTNLARLLS